LGKDVKQGRTKMASIKKNCDENFVENNAKCRCKKQNNAQKSKKVREGNLSRRKRERIEYINSVEYKVSKLANQQKNYKNWYKLDNAALMYPFTASNTSNSIFRMSVQLDEAVDALRLQQAINDVYPRFPTICGAVKNGLFWPYIDKPSYPIVATLQKKLPCRPLEMDGKRSNLRVTYFHHEISIEIFHSATDGTGALTFFNTLLKRYFELAGEQIVDQTNCLDHRDLPSQEELRDNFRAIAIRKNPPPLPKQIKSVRFCGKPLADGLFVTRRGTCDANQLREVAQKYNATVTQLLGAVQLMALDHFRKVTASDSKYPVRVLVPVNLRKIYDVDTLRNFSSYIFYQYNGQSTLEEVIADIKKQAADQTCDSYFRGMVSYNFNSGNHPLLKIVPVGIKHMAVSAVCRRMGDGVVNCATLSNVGVVRAPAEFAKHVLRYEFQLGKPMRKTINFAVATYNGFCTICVGNSFAETDCERYFFTKLAELGVDVVVESDIVEGL